VARHLHHEAPTSKITACFSSQLTVVLGHNPALRYKEPSSAQCRIGRGARIDRRGHEAVFCTFARHPTGSSAFFQVVRSPLSCRTRQGGLPVRLEKDLGQGLLVRLSGDDLGLDNAFQRSVLDVQDIGKHQVCRYPFTQVGHNDDAALG